MHVADDLEQACTEHHCFESIYVYMYICIYVYQQGLGISFMLKGWLRLPRSLAMDGSVSKTKGLEDSVANGYKTSASANEWGDVAFFFKRFDQLSIR